MTEEPSGGTTGVVSVLDSTLASVDKAEQLVLEAAEAMGFDEDTRYQIGMAVREALVNAVVHGNCYSEHKKVRLGIAKTEDRLTVTVTDEGKGFDVESLPDPLAQENLLNQSGRGIFLMKAFMDEFDAEKLDPFGTRFKLVKYLQEKGA
jgi:serine/threonine-protein kinase RsbW